MTGVQWFDNGTKSLAQKILDAASYAKRILSLDAEYCVISKTLAAGVDLNALSIKTGLRVIVEIPSMPVPPGHVFVGLEVKPASK
jgi:hypothetical protein